MIRVLPFKHRNGTLAATGINSFSGLVVEHVITITYCGQALDGFSCIGIEDEQSCREPSYHEQSVLGLVEGHRIIRQGRSEWPCRDNRARFSVENCDLA